MDGSNSKLWTSRCEHYGQERRQTDPSDPHRQDRGCDALIADASGIEEKFPERRHFRHGAELYQRDC